MHSLAILVPAAAVDALSDLLGDELGALSVSVEDADAGSADEEPVFDEPGTGATGTWRRAAIDALFVDADAAVMAAAAVSAAADVPGATIVSITKVDDADWVRLTQAQFQATAITPAFWIVPTWCDVPASAERWLRLDPGRAFGTGTHPTTRMCLRWIADQGDFSASDLGRRVLDYGDGSGVLAIAAGLFGAAAIDAVDVDVDAIDAARANAELNRVGLRSGGPELASGRYSLVLANIHATPLKVQAPLLCSLLDDGGTLLLSGILARQAKELQAAYSPWLEIEVVQSEDGWILMAGSRPPAVCMA